MIQHYPLTFDLHELLSYCSTLLCVDLCLPPERGLEPDIDPQTMVDQTHLFLQYVSYLYVLDLGPLAR